jgi:glycosyltransferase involved in cell wall biosynthesis
MGSPEVSIVIPTRNEGPFLLYTLHWILANSGDPEFEIVVVDDGSTDDSVRQVLRFYGTSDRVRVVEGERRGPARARNLGAREAKGRQVVFIDGHCYTPPGWLRSLVAPLSDPKVALVGCALADLRQPGVGAGVGCTWGGPALDMVWLPQQAQKAYPVPLLPGGCQALRSEDFFSFGLFDSGMTHIGSEGEEQSLRCWLMGYEVVVDPRVVVHHLFRDRPPYEVRAGELIYNRLRTALLHFTTERVARVVDALKLLPFFSNQLVPLLESEVLEQRALWHSRRVRSDDWFCQRFGIPV